LARTPIAGLPVGHVLPAAQPSPAASWWHAWPDGWATSAATCAACSCVAAPLWPECMSHGAAACASRLTHIGKPLPAVATDSATARRMARRAVGAREWWITAVP